MSYNLRSQNNSFSRSTANEAKMGAYYTDLDHCRSLSDLFKWPEGGVSVLEPSIGDGSAVITVCEPDINTNVKIFGVELNEEVAKETKNNPLVEDVLSADFTNGVKIKNNFFTFCFGNPPYMDDEDVGDKRGRLEKTFLEKVTGNYLKKGGILVWVIPYRVFSDISYIRYLYSHYEKIGVWKFRESEYKKWHQVVYVGRKIDTTFRTAEAVQAEAKLYSDVDLIPELPSNFSNSNLYQSVEVMESDPADLKLFTTSVFDAFAAYEMLTTGLYLEDSGKLVSRYTTQKEFKASDLGKPPIPLKKDSMYLMATSGAGQGETGEPGEDFHLQRGVAEVVEDIEYAGNEDDPNAPEVMKVTTRTEVSMTIIETSGKITVLK